MKKVIYDSILKRINISEPIISELIDTIEFQRLNRIKQLGLVHYLFPGATHTRYAHSIGTFELTQRFLDQLSSNANISKNDMILIKIAALLHDLGHGPLSHLFESISNINHEKYTIDLILEPSTEVNKVLKNHLTDFQISEIVAIISKTHKIPWFNQIISSDVDVDRLDYLMRDSYYTGLKYGEIEFEWIIKNAFIFENNIIYHQKAISSLESLIVGRFHMYESVYLNLKTIAFSEQINFLFNRVKYLYEQDYKFEIENVLYKKLILNDSFLYSDLIKLNDDNMFTFIESMMYEKDELLNQISINILRGVIPEIFNLANPEELNNFNNQIQNKIEGIHFKIINKSENFNDFYTLNDNPKIFINNEIKNLFDISTIITNHPQNQTNSTLINQIGVIIK